MFLFFVSILLALENMTDDWAGVAAASDPESPEAINVCAELKEELQLKQSYEEALHNALNNVKRVTSTDDPNDVEQRRAPAGR